MVKFHPHRGNRDARHNANAGVRFWGSWFVMTSMMLWSVLSLLGNQDAASDFLSDIFDSPVDAPNKKTETTNGSRHLSLEKESHDGTPRNDAKEGYVLGQETKSNPPTPENDSKRNHGFKEEVYFLNHTHLAHNDGFSASWLQTRKDFMSMPFEDMQTCEMTAFKSYNGPRMPKMRMTLDWMQFSVEHMSRWWRILEWDKHEIVYQKITTQFQIYLEAASKFPMEERVFQHTIAVIAFQSYRSQDQPEQAHNLTALSLAVTVESLRRAGFGRVVVGILGAGDIPMIEDAFWYLAKQFDDKAKGGEAITKIDHMEIGYAYSSSAYIKTKHLEKNMPRATVMTLRDVFLYSMEPAQNRTDDMNGNITSWLGSSQDPSYWQYVYLTEPDTLLSTRLSALPSIKNEIDQGGVVLPHRWQPIPHESDVRGMEKEKGLFLLEEEFPQVLELDPIKKHDACCDENRGRDFKPGLPPFHDKCGKGLFWYSCGFLSWNRKLPGPEKHARLKPYPLMRLLGGTEITTIAGSEHARRCIPKKNGICRPGEIYEINENASLKFDNLTTT